MAAKSVKAKGPATKRSTFGGRIAKSLEYLNSPSDIRRSYATERLAVCKAETLNRYRGQGILQGIAKHLQREHSPTIRINCVRILAKIGGRAPLPLIKKSVFDFNRDVRGVAANALAKRIGWKNTLSFIDNRFKNAGNVPATFFYFTRRRGGKEVVTWKPVDWRSVKKDAQAFKKEKPLHEIIRMKDKNGKPFSIHGMPVFIGYATLDRHATGAHWEGTIIVDYRTPFEFRQAVAWHELGETFSHNVGLAFEYNCLKRKGLWQEYLKATKPGAEKEFKEIIKNWERPKTAS